MGQNKDTHLTAPLSTGQLLLYLHNKYICLLFSKEKRWLSYMISLANTEVE